MKFVKVLLAIAMSVLIVSITANATTLIHPIDKTSYALGFVIGHAIEKNNRQTDVKIFEHGIDDAMTHRKALMTHAEIKHTLIQFQKNKINRILEQRKKLADKNKKAGEAFLKKNKLKQGVVTLQNGLQYRVIQLGSGRPPKSSDQVKVDYQGRLINGKIFDSSYQRGKPTTFLIKTIIPGWRQALELMKPGATWMLYIPSDLAYGKRGVSGKIPPNATLVFKVHLIQVMPR